MSGISRREILKGGLALCTAASAPGIVQAAEPQSARTFATHPYTEETHGLPQERMLLDAGWRFRLGNADDPEKDLDFGAPAGFAAFAKTNLRLPAAKPDYDDGDWQAIDLPHDWEVELPFAQGPFLDIHGAKPIGRDYPDTSIGWYRRIFSLDKTDAGKRISLLFDGIFRHAMVVVNDMYAGHTDGGYSPEYFDVTDFVTTEGPNVLLVRVDATLGEGWFYEGAGIYRHVWLLKKEPVHMRIWSPVVRTPKIQGIVPETAKASSATVALECEAVNQSDSEALCSFNVEILDSSGSTVARSVSGQERLPVGESRQLRAETILNGPRLWSIEEPNLYRGIFSLVVNGKAADRETVSFGVRTLRFNASRGFFLNGKNVKIKGTCNHQDHAGVGSALPDRLQSYRLEILKEMGSNAYRTAHNPPTPELLEASDQLGMLMMVETRMMSSSPAGLDQLEKMVRRFRNHPSIMIWSLGNEEPIQGTEYGTKIVRTMRALARKLDPTRLCTAAMNGSWGKGISNVLDVQGFNYFKENIDEFHTKFPNQPSIGTEVAATVSTRGIYENDPVRGYVSSYDNGNPQVTQGTTAEQWWKFYDSRPFLAGCFVWAGFDYRGEPVPYKGRCISTNFGIIDTCGFPKDLYFYYRTWWGKQPALHLFPHWNWSGREGQPIDVWCFSNLDSVELFLNGSSLGSKRVEKNSHLVWKVNYAPGTIEARGSKDGKVVLVETHETTGTPTGVALHPDRVQIAADGRDVSVVRVEIIDERGRTVPIAGNLVEFAVEGPARILGVGNGDPSCHEPDKASRRSAFNGLCMAIVQSLPHAGEITLHAKSAGLAPGRVVLRSV